MCGALYVGKAITPYEPRLPQLEVWAEGLLTDRLMNESFFLLERDGTFFFISIFFREQEQEKGHTP